MEVLLATANVGSIFEEPDVMLKGWLNVFLRKLSELNPQFVAIHCQEVGGKNYESSMQYVGGFVDSILSSVEASGFNKSLVILDEDYSVAENFTALGNIYMIRKDLEDCNFPNPYSLNRRRALDHTVQRFFHDGLDNVPSFIFGDFNFRLDTGTVVKVCTGGEFQPTEETKGVSQFFGENNDLLFTLGKKEFARVDHDEFFLKEKGDWLLPFDREMEDFRGTLFEFGIKFPPTYPYEEDVKAPCSLMRTRCPSWCDRVLLSHSARLLVDDMGSIIYDIIGFDTCTGDHKPVFLKLRMKKDMGDGKDVVWERQDSVRGLSRRGKGKSLAVEGSSCPVVSSLDSCLPAHDFLCPSCRAAPLDRSQSERKRPARRTHQVASSTLSADACRNCRRARPGPRVRMHLLARGSSSRPLSHHSSSDEEWFERVVEDGNAKNKNAEPPGISALPTSSDANPTPQSQFFKACCCVS
ncbi:unnamed protein product [Notodromas monacha]|uniref:inositol-polyphosphate 5-phosphatase n=1 Tax=Notodromas monacha TaxID=399045 RepID=A0A7R9G9G5_9CRUS|nr:unnamed protein product [Notodromas monacha]CAG0914241.1 unnamed protein product [Notodromas monacha]